MASATQITLTPRDRIAGLPAMRVRQALVNSRSIIWPACIDQLLVDKQTALAVLDQVVAEGYLAPEKDSGRIKVWTRTKKGDCLARATVPPPVLRGNALQLLDRTINFLNSLNRLPHTELDEHVVGVHVIGELLTGFGETIPHMELQIDVGSKTWSSPDPQSKSIVTDEEVAPIAWGSAIYDRLVEFDPTICWRVRQVG